MKIFITVFKLGGIVALTIKGTYFNKYKYELSFLYATYRQNLFVINIKYYDNIPKGIQVVEQA